MRGSRVPPRAAPVRGRMPCSILCQSPLHQISRSGVGEGRTIDEVGEFSALGVGEFSVVKTTLRTGSTRWARARKSSSDVILVDDVVYCILMVLNLEPWPPSSGPWPAPGHDAASVARPIPGWLCGSPRCWGPVCADGIACSRQARPGC